MTRVVITGMGLITPLGNNVRDNWISLKNEYVAIDYIDLKIKNLHPIAAELKNFNVLNFINDKNLIKYDPFIQYGIACGIQAIDDSGFIVNSKIRKKAGVIFGSGIGGISLLEDNILSEYINKRVSPHFINGVIINTIPGYLSKIYNLNGLSLGVSTACATSSQAIYIASNLIKSGNLKVVIVGGSEKATTKTCITGFNSMKALANNHNPKLASRPWDADRNGFVLGDGAGCVVMEDYDHALNRGAKIYAEILGSYTNCDSYDIVAPKPNGSILFECMNSSIKLSGITPDHLNYINAHATSTLLGDLAESKAIHSLLSSSKNNVIISSTKSMTGHLLGAAGIVELIFTVLMSRNGFIPKNVNLYNLDVKLPKLNYCTKSEKHKINYAMSNSIGFCGVNSSIVIKSF